MKEQRCHCSDKHKHYRWDASQPPAANPWNTCRAGPRFGPEFLSCGSKRRAGLAVFVCVSAPALLPVALRCQPAHRPPVRPVEHSPAATAQHRHPSDWGFLLDWLKCLLFSTLLEFNTSLFTGPHVAPVSLSPPPPFFVHVFPPFHNIPSLYGVCILLLHKVRTQHTYEVEFLPVLDGPHDISCGVNHTGQYEVDWLFLSFITKTITCSNE